MILYPPNDGECLKQLLQLAAAISRTAEARQIVGELGTMARVEEAIRSRPNLPDDGRAKDRTIACDVPQRARFWAPASNCVEDTLDFVVAHEILDPGEDITAVTVRLPGGELHTAPVVDPYGPRNRVVILSHSAREKLATVRVRNATVDDPEAETPWWKTGFGYAHQIGGGVLSIFGLGGAADALGNVERQYGLLDAPQERAPAWRDENGGNDDGEGEEDAAPQQRRRAAEGDGVRDRRRRRRDRRAGRRDRDV